jgi:hypothetical protein
MAIKGPNLEKVMGYVTDRIQDYSRQRRKKPGKRLMSI